MQPGTSLITIVINWKVPGTSDLPIPYPIRPVWRYTRSARLERDSYANMWGLYSRDSLAKLYPMYCGIHPGILHRVNRHAFGLFENCLLSYQTLHFCSTFIPGKWARRLLGARFLWIFCQTIVYTFEEVGYRFSQPVFLSMYLVHFTRQMQRYVQYIPGYDGKVKTT